MNNSIATSKTIKLNFNKITGMKAIIFCFFIICLFGCQIRERSNTQIISIPVNSQEVGEFGKISDVLIPIKYIELENEGGRFIGRIDKIEYLDNIFIILDRINMQVIGFDGDGNHRFTYDNEGEGPGEFRHLIDITVDRKKEQIFILDQSKIITLDRNGHFINEVKLTHGGLGFEYAESSGEFYMLLGRGHPMLVGKINIDGHMVDDFIEKDNLNRMLNKESLFKDGDDVFLNLYLNDTVYKVSSNGVLPNVYLDFDKKIKPEIYDYLNKDYSIEKILEVLPHTMSNINFFRRVNEKFFGVFHYQDQMHWMIACPGDGGEMITKVYNVSKTQNDLSFEEQLEMPISVDRQGHLIFVLNPESLNPENLENFLTAHPTAKSFKESLLNMRESAINPFLMISEIIAE